MKPSNVGGDRRGRPHVPTAGLQGVRRIVRAISISASVAILAPGCYRYALVDTDAVAIGAHARARVTTEQAVRLADLIGTTDRVVRGEVVTRDSSGLILSVPTVTVTEGLNSRRLHQRIEIPRSGIVELETRRFDKLRSGFLIGAGAAVITYIVASQFVGSSAPGGGGKPLPDQIVVPIIRF
jgi:hypothetical protein